MMENHIFIDTPTGTPSHQQHEHKPSQILAAHPGHRSPCRDESRAFVWFVASFVPAGAEEGVIPAREGTLHVLSFGVGAPMDGPPVDDLYGRDAGFVAEALKRSPSAWTRVETTFVSGLACTPERLRTELERLGKAASASDLVLIHASTHGTTEDGFL